MKRSKLIMASLIFATAISVMSCKKNSEGPAMDSDVSGPSDNALAENTSNDVVAIASQASDNTDGNLNLYKLGGSNQLLSSCASVVKDSVNRTITVTFNNSTCLDGRTRNGSILIDFSGSTNGAIHYRDPGFSCSISSNNYTVDGNQVSILSKTILNTTPFGFDPNTTNETWSINSNINIVKATGGTVTWTSSRVKTLLNTSSVYTNPATPINWHNARIGITGSANGTRANGETFSITVTGQLIRDFGGCNINGRHPFIQGTLEFVRTGKPTRYVDYGSGTCDLLATVTINGVSHTITLP